MKSHSIFIFFDPGLDDLGLDIVGFTEGGIMNYNQGAYADGLTTGYTPSEISFISDDGILAAVFRDNLHKCQLVEDACFPANTPIQIQNGTKVIQDIAVGDFVIAYDEIQKDTTLARVKQTFSKSWQKMIRLITGNDTITATSNHPFYLPKLGRYMPADSLRRGMQVLALAGTLLTVQSAMAFDSSMTVYNFEVEDYHNYFVGNEGVLVHNHCVLTAAGLRRVNSAGVTEFDWVDDILEELYPGTSGQPQRALVKRTLIDDIENNPLLNSFFRGENLVDLGLTPAQFELRIKDRVKAWEDLKNFEDFATNVNILESYTTIKRLGEYGNDLIEFRVTDLVPTHPVPRPGNESVIPLLKQEFQSSGYILDPNDAIMVIELPNGSNLLINGNHRLQAMVATC